MGTLFQYTCNQCSYSVEASKKEEWIFAGLLHPCTCTYCRQLFMVKVGDHTTAGEGVTVASYSHLHCPNCKQVNQLQQWDGHTCPQCDTGTMEQDEKIIIMID